jgi:hypothetical protein
MSSVLRSRTWQALAILATVVFIAGLHWRNDGLWYGDAPLHAANGLFWWDFLSALPADPVEYTVRYYARYPVIKPGAYPPLFYLLEGFAFALFGASPHLAKAIVLAFTALAGVYTLAWARRWIAAWAGWSGALLVLTPGVVMWSNAVMLNMPATALSLGALYHFRRWIERDGTRQLVLASAFAAGVLMTYFAGGTVLLICGAWALWQRRGPDVGRPALWAAAAALAAAVPLGVALLLGPVQAIRNLPSPMVAVNPQVWTFYALATLEVTGRVVLALGTIGLAAGLTTARWRREAAFIAVWIAVHVIVLSMVPARDARYVILLIPALLLAACVGVAALSSRFGHVAPLPQAMAVAATLAAAAWSATRVQVPEITGIREVAEYLRSSAPHDAVLWDGTYGAVFAFYVRALDPTFERRVVAGNKLLYEYGPGSTFTWTQTSYVKSTRDVVEMVRRRSGCPWIVIAEEPLPSWLEGRNLLRAALAGPEFELVRSFPATGMGDRNVRLYRSIDPVDPVETQDLRFPSFGNREFRQVRPIAR